MNYWAVPGFKIKLGNKKDPMQDEQILETVIETVVEVCKVNRKKMMSKDRARELVIARNFCYLFTKKYTAYSLKEIGIRFAGRDHTTVIHGIRTTNDLMAIKDPAITRLHELIQTKFTQII